ncbi:protein NO VEIN-like [Bidens hawaiensis]|uniref:protein NO VEIN-like n=1 Tax=Bidens hawaiensis TaxID=980011 RepID=UPI00404A1A39
MAVTSAKQHVAEIRRTKFSIGGQQRSPLTDELQQVVNNLSAELYAKDVDFLIELIQNADDNKYPDGVDPSLEFVITSKDITNTGAPATLLVFNNEKGFLLKTSILFVVWDVPRRKVSVSMVILGKKCKISYIVPEWVEEDQTSSAIKSIYSSATALPTTVLVLPLKPEKVKHVKDQLSSVHPEVILFLSKIKRFSIRERNENPKFNTVSQILTLF